MRPGPARRNPEGMSQATGVSQSAAVDHQAPGLTGTYLTSNWLLTSARALTAGSGDSKSVVSSRDFQPQKERVHRVTRQSSGDEHALHPARGFRGSCSRRQPAVVVVGDGEPGRPGRAVLLIGAARPGPTGFG